MTLASFNLRHKKCTLGGESRRMHLFVPVYIFNCKKDALDILQSAFAFIDNTLLAADEIVKTFLI